jgi:hypothetical protein
MFVAFFDLLAKLVLSIEGSVFFFFFLIWVAIGADLVQLKIEPMSGPAADVSSSSTNHSSNPSYQYTTTSTTTTSTTPTLTNGTTLDAHTSHTDTYTRFMLVVDHLAKHFPKAVSQQLPLTQDHTPPKPAHTRPPTPPSTATPITQAAHLLLCDEEVPLESGVGGGSDGESMGGVCPPNLEKTVLGVLNNTLKSIISAVAVD